MRTTCIILLQLFFSFGAFAQDEDSSVVVPPEDVDEELRENQAVLDPQAWPSARADGMGRALSPFADQTDAPYYNPAGIGGFHNGKKKRKSAFRNFHYPYVGATLNDNAREVHADMASSGGAQEEEMETAVLDANAGKRQYGRLSAFPNAGVGRSILGPIYDAQLAAVPVGDETDIVDLHYQERYGFGLGASVGSEVLYLGFYTQYEQIKDVRGYFLYDDIVDVQARKDAFSEVENNYSGFSGNVGLLWRVSKKASPSFSLVARDVGDSTFTKTSGDGSEILEREQDLTLGFGVAPALGKIGYFNFSVEGANLTAEEKSIRKKWRTGMELLLGKQRGALCFFGLRAGYNDAGHSFGSHINVGLINIQYANFAEDIGYNNTRLIERRQTAVVAIDLAN